MDSQNEESPAQRAARERRERREAKIKEQGASRLQKISQLSGRQLARHDSDELSANQQRDFENKPQQTQESRPPPVADDIDPSQRERARVSAVKENRGSIFPRTEDPTLALLQEMMSSLSPDNNAAPGAPPDLASLLGGISEKPTFPPGSTATQGRLNEANAFKWRILHIFFTCLLFIYVASYSIFSTASSSLSRGEYQSRSNIFWLFATAELILQSTRYFFDEDYLQSNLDGWKGLLLGLVPMPYRSSLTLLSRYSKIWTTFLEDAMLLLFLIGLALWWKGDAN